jgi:arylsulfatase A-like enzyme
MTRNAMALVLVLVAGAQAADRPPNIILMMADDLGIGHVGAYGQTKIKTPNIDRLAAQGMRFTQFYAGANVCAPSRSVLMTGLHTGHTPVRNNGLDRHLYDQDVTIAEVLKKAGYATGGFGKWGLGRETNAGAPVRQGFDEWVGQYSQVHAHFFYPYYLMHNLERMPLPQNEGKQRGLYAADVTHEHSMKFIRANAQAGRPFFAYIPTILPHVELTCPEDSWTQYKGLWPVVKRADPRPGYLGSDDAIAEFAGMVSRLDSHVGQLLALLKELNIDDHTVFIFTSDNGPQPGPWTDIFVDFFDGNGPYRGSKTNFYEGGIREPFLVRWPGRIKPGSVSDHLGFFGDILPTLADLAGASTHVPTTDGLSIVPTLLGRGEQKQHDYLYWEAAGSTQNVIEQAVRWGDWKAIRPNARSSWELYNLKSDLAETTNLASQHPDVLQRLQRIADQARTPERVYQAAPKESAADYVR